MQPIAVVPLENQGLFQRGHGDEGIDAVMLGRFKPVLGVPGGNEVGVRVDHPARALLGRGIGLRKSIPSRL